MRIGIVPASFRAAGGTFQYSLTFLDVLREIRSGDELVVFHYPVTDLPLAQLRAWSFETVASNLLGQQSLVKAGLFWVLNSVERLLGTGPVARAWRDARRRLSRSIGAGAWAGDVETIAYRSRSWRRLFGRHRIELMIYLGETEWSFEIGIPYVMAIQDLLFCFHPEFPEAFATGPPDYYEYLYRNGTRHATLILVDAEAGKEDVLRFYGRYGITADRVKVLPFLPAPYLPRMASTEDTRTVAGKYRLPTRYLFYPARFWLHKNHARLFEALDLLKTRHQLEIPLVLVGFDTSDTPPRAEISLHDMRARSRQCGIDEQVRYLGVVPDADMAGLYAAATGLIMPSLSGPTNIPVVEAWQLGCPVITSDIRGIREHAGDAAILVDPFSVDAIAEGIRQVWTDGALRRALAQRGRDRLGTYTREDYARRVAEILEDAKSRATQDKQLHPPSG